MAISLSATEKANIQHAVDLMVLGSARETPFDATCIESVAKTAVSTGFSAGDDAFKQAMRDNPFSTLLNFLLFVGA